VKRVLSGFVYDLRFAHARERPLRCSAAVAAEALGKMGYKNAISLDGGWRAWNEAGLPVVKE